MFFKEEQVTDMEEEIQFNFVVLDWNWRYSYEFLDGWRWIDG